LPVYDTGYKFKAFKRKIDEQSSLMYFIRFLLKAIK